MSGSKIHSVQITAYDHRSSSSEELPEEAAIEERGAVVVDEQQLRHAPRRASNSRAIHDDASINGPNTLIDAEELGMPGVYQVHAPFPGQLEACQGCGRLSVSGVIGSGPSQTCDECSYDGGVLRGKENKMGGLRGGSRAADVVAVTSSREIALSQAHLTVLRVTGFVMLAMSTLLLLLLLVAW